MQPFKFGGVQSSDGIGHARWFADAVGIYGSDSEVVGVPFKQPRHWVFTDFNGVIIALSPVLCSNLTSEMFKERKTRKAAWLQ